MLRVGTIELGVRQQQMLAIAMREGHLCSHANEFRQPLRRLDERLGDVDSDHTAAEARGDVARRPTDPTPDVEDEVFRPDVQHVGQFDRRSVAACVIVVDRVSRVQAIVQTIF